MRILVTAGRPANRSTTSASSPTLPPAVSASRWPLAALGLGHRVVLVVGPTPIPPPFGPETVRVETAAGMREACLAAFPTVDAVIMTAAVADYRPAERVAGKMKKEAVARELPLAPTADVLAELSALRTGQFLVGFALEAADGEENARKKLLSKGLDLIVLDSPATIGAERSDFVLLAADGRREHYRSISKEILALRLVSFVADAKLSQDR